MLQSTLPLLSNAETLTLSGSHPWCNTQSYYIYPQFVSCVLGKFRMYALPARCSITSAPGIDWLAPAPYLLYLITVNPRKYFGYTYPFLP
ncbi:hypothetical protein AB205_0114180 [Aquarana catesbeiana]|uniref:Uncharacterized protein n=1 Tax=Aquarana catesbeiana TaxID=8400 RepID=A0A2G9RN92_AQUCT|nr:hypothetical protein AB205_0114180 [Aquarana catesbeiana]